jgi:hypothetical protein
MLLLAPTPTLLPPMSRATQVSLRVHEVGYNKCEFLLGWAGPWYTVTHKLLCSCYVRLNEYMGAGDDW